MNYEVKPNFKECGKLFGKNVKDFTEILKSYTIDDIENIDGKEIEINGEKYVLNKDMLDIRVHSKEGFNTSSDGINYVILDVKITNELLNEGILRDLIRQCQVIRKNIGLDIADRIKLEIITSEDLKSSIIDNYKSEIESELLASLVADLDSEVNEFVDDAGNCFKIKMVKN